MQREDLGNLSSRAFAQRHLRRITGQKPTESVGVCGHVHVKHDKGETHIKALVPLFTAQSLMTTQTLSEFPFGLTVDQVISNDMTSAAEITYKG